MRFIWLFIFLLVVFGSRAQPSFHVVPLGVKGGINEGNLSSYMIAPTSSNAYVCLDGGTVNAGIQKAITNSVFTISADSVLKSYIKGYLISHAHLDHIAGLLINATDDTKKYIYAFPKCLEIIRNHYFNWESWPNFGSEGAGIALKKYTYKPLAEGELMKLENTGMRVAAYKLSHANPYESAAFLVGTQDSYVLYIGDTGPDELEKTDHLQQIWKVAAPLIHAGKLSGIFLEVSYPNDQPDAKLYGHLNPKWFYKEMDKLSELAGSEKVSGLNVVITHIKPTDRNEEKIKTELNQKNTLKLNLIFPEQGIAFDL